MNIIFVEIIIFRLPKTGHFLDNKYLFLQFRTSFVNFLIKNKIYSNNIFSRQFVPGNYVYCGITFPGRKEDSTFWSGKFMHPDTLKKYVDRPSYHQSLRNICNFLYANTPRGKKIKMRTYRAQVGNYWRDLRIFFWENTWIMGNWKSRVRTRANSGIDISCRLHLWAIIYKPFTLYTFQK